MITENFIRGIPAGLALLAMAAACAVASAAEPDGLAAPVGGSVIYVPYKDLAAAVEPVGRTVLMDRQEFAKLLAAAGQVAEHPRLGQVTRADYVAVVGGGKQKAVEITGELAVCTLSDQSVAVPLAFGQAGLTEVSLDGKPAPLGFDSRGRLVLIVPASTERAGAKDAMAEHKVRVSASSVVSDMASGGSQFGMVIPPAVAGTFRFTSPGDLSVHANVPVSARSYDKTGDRTSAELTIGGSSSLTVVLLGNGRQEDQRAIMVGESVTSVQLTRAGGMMNCVYTVQVLHKSVGELLFEMPRDWTVTDVTCPNLVRWDIDDKGKSPGGAKAGAGGDCQVVKVRLRAPVRGAQAVNIQACSAGAVASTWVSPWVNLRDAAFQRGFLAVDVGDALRVRGETMVSARRENQAETSAVSSRVGRSALVGLGDHLYYHWGPRWAVQLDLSTVDLRRGSEDRQDLAILGKEILLSGSFRASAIGRAMYDVSYELPPASAGWEIAAVSINGNASGVEYRLSDAEPNSPRTLKIDLPSPVQPEGVIAVGILLRHVPSGWNWTREASDGSKAAGETVEISVPLIRPLSDTVSGVVSVVAGDDLKLSAASMPASLKEVNVGRMAALGLAGNVSRAWTYETPPSGEMRLRVSREKTALRADSAGLVSVAGNMLTGVWQISYRVSGASTRRFEFLADKTLGETIRIDVPGRRLASRKIVSGAQAAGIPATCNLWALDLDSPASAGDAMPVIVQVGYDQPLPAGEFRVPLIRPRTGGESPAAADHAQSRPGGARGDSMTNEFLAVQAGEERAVTVTATAAAEIDAVDLPPLPVPARRILSAWRLEGASLDASVVLKTSVHDIYAIPSALATSARYITHLGCDAQQQTEAVFEVANAGLQFLKIHLPPDARLLSLRVGKIQIKPNRDADGDYLAALPRSASTAVRVVYTCRSPLSRGLDRVELGAAVLAGVNINKSEWIVIPPAGVVVTGQETKMQTREMSMSASVSARLLDVFNGIKSISLKKSKRSSREFDRAQETANDYEADDYHFSDKIAKSDSDKREERAVARQDEVKERLAARPAKSSGFYLDKSIAAGRFTLPVAIIPPPEMGNEVTFTTLGSPHLVIRCSSEKMLSGQQDFGFFVVMLIGMALLRASGRMKATMLFTLGLQAVLLGLWSMNVENVALGMLRGVLVLVVLYPLLAVASAILRWISKLLLRRGFMAAAIGLTVVFCGLASAWAGGAEPAGTPVISKTEAVAKGEPQSEKRDAAAVVIPYDGDPTRAEQSTKVLVPYEQFVKMWNKVHPDDKLAVPEAASPSVSLADVKYLATFEGEKMKLVLRAQVKVTGKGFALLALPMSGVAVTEALFAGQPAQLQETPKGMVLMLPGETSGELRIAALTTPASQGRKGSVKMILPPLPAAVMNVVLPQDDLELEVPGAEGAVTMVTSREGALWNVPLGSMREVNLRWMPRAGVSAADRTLSAAVAHDVYAYHWAMVGVSKFVFTFSAADYDRFVLLAPSGVTITDLTGANLRDYRLGDEKVVDGQKMRVVEVRLHRAAAKQYDLTMRWIADVPPMEKQAVTAPQTHQAGEELLLPRAGETGRESGTVALHAAGGMFLRITDVSGGRRSSIPERKAAQAGDGTSLVAQYYWPYRPFSLKLSMSRVQTREQCRLDQLVRVSPERVQLLARAEVSVASGRLFGTSFLLPDGYELLSAAGAAVSDYYVQGTGKGRRLHVNFRNGVERANISLVLLRSDVPESWRSRDKKADKTGADLAVPSVMLIDAQGEPLAAQTGRLAVQIAPAMDAQTAGSENLKPVAPSTLAGWLTEDEQIRAVRFAYSYETPRVSLTLAIRRQPTRIRVENLAGVSIHPTGMAVTYRLRYNIEGSPVDRLSFTLPTRHASGVVIGCPIMRSVSHADAGDSRTRWTVSLMHEATDVLDMTVNFTIPFDRQEEGSRSIVEIPQLFTDAPDGYQAVAAVQNFSSHKVEIKSSSKLADLPAGEQRRLLAAEVLGSLQYVGQSFDADWALRLEVTMGKTAQRVQAVVDLLAMTTVVDREGRARYEVSVSLQNRSEQFLRVKVPAGLWLWSSQVAGEPVRPVLPGEKPAFVSAGSPAAFHAAHRAWMPPAVGEVLIPLVKTSAGGLPYDVKMYFAGEGLTPLSGITRLNPPAVQIAGLPVMRTTWSLRLPGEFKYVRPGGNVSPVAGTAEMMSLAIDARLGQLKRLGSYAQGLSGSNQTLVAGNWKNFNDQVSDDIKTLKTYIDNNRGSLRQEDYSRLKAKVELQFDAQHSLAGAWDQQAQADQKKAQGNINLNLNGGTLSVGVSEAARNQALTTLPSFVRQAAQEQEKEITQELKQNEELEQRKTKEAAEEKKPAGTLSQGDGLVALEGDKQDQAVAQVLQSLQAQQQRGVAMRQTELKNQLAQLGDNRMARFYNANPYGGNAPLNVPGNSGGLQQITVANNYAGNTTATGGALQLNSANTYNGGMTLNGAASIANSDSGQVTLTYDNNGQLAFGNTLSNAGAPQSQLPADGRRMEARDTRANSARDGGGSAESKDAGAYFTSSPDAAKSARADQPEQASATRLNGPGGLTKLGAGVLVLDAAVAGEAYVAAGTFSLPVSLPDGAVTLDFTRVGGDAEVTLWAVPTGMVNGAYGTGAAAVSVVAFCGIMAMLRRVGGKARATNRKRLLWIVAAIAILALIVSIV